ncbi:MAG: purine-nucleoside phosphorylase [Patescibacteria group bacterium]
MENRDLYGYESAQAAADFLRAEMTARGMNPDSLLSGVITGSGLGSFSELRLGALSYDVAGGTPSSPLVLPFDKVLQHVALPLCSGDGVGGHKRRLVIGPMKSGVDGLDPFVIVQDGREHPYEGIDTKRATFWLRVMQVLGIKNLIGSNAAGSITPGTIKRGDLMLIHSHIDDEGDSPLVGPNDERLGPRFPSTNNLYPRETREIIKAVAEKEEIPLKEGLFFRKKGPNYESPEQVYDARRRLRGILEEGTRQSGEDRFPRLRDPLGVFGMSTSYEAMAVSHAAQREIKPGDVANPVFVNRAWVSAVTNFAGGLDIHGVGSFPNHAEVSEMGRSFEDRFGRLVSGAIVEMERAA